MDLIKLLIYLKTASIFSLQTVSKKESFSWKFSAKLLMSNKRHLNLLEIKLSKCQSFYFVKMFKNTRRNYRKQEYLMTEIQDRLALYSNSFRSKLTVLLLQLHLRVKELISYLLFDKLMLCMFVCLNHISGFNKTVEEE